MRARIRILIVDDHAIVRQGLKQILEEEPMMEVVAEHANGADALDWLCGNDCDVAVIDIAMSGMSGVDLLKRLCEEKPELRVLVLSIYAEDQYAVRLIRVGAYGYLNKECAPEEIVDAVQCIANGKKYFSQAVIKMLVKEDEKAQEKPTHEILSEREYQILILLASSRTATEIANELGLSVKTVSTYRSRVLEKMRLRNNSELMRYAIENNLTQYPPPQHKGR